MKETIVSFKVAKLAKDKGFNEIPCHYVYDEGILKQSYQAFNRLNFELAPTQSLLQRWLREVHNINIESNFTMGLNYSFTIYKGLVIKGNTEVACYEKSLEKALIIGLKQQSNE